VPAIEAKIVSEQRSREAAHFAQDTQKRLPTDDQFIARSTLCCKAEGIMVKP
jgi:hypothetical protein